MRRKPAQTDRSTVLSAPPELTDTEVRAARMLLIRPIARALAEIGVVEPSATLLEPVACVIHSLDAPRR